MDVYSDKIIRECQKITQNMQDQLFYKTINTEIFFSELRHVKIYKILMVLLLLLSLGIYIVLPKHANVSMPLFYYCFVMMLISNIIYFRSKRKKNYLDFDTIFIFVYCLVGFSTTWFYEDIFLYRAIFLSFPVDVEYVNSGNILFLIGLQSYTLGSMNSNSTVINHNKGKSTINSQLLVFLVIFLILAFIASGGVSYYRSIYDLSIESGGPGISKHILLLLISVSIVVISTEFYNKKLDNKYKINKLAFISIFLVVILLLWSGNRTAASQLLLPVICLYTLFFKNLNLKKFLMLSILGIIFMWFLQNTRANIDNIELKNPIFVILDLTIPARSTYSAFAYVEDYGYTYGKTMSMSVIGVVPFLPSLLVEEDKTLSKGSSELLTDYTFDTYKIPEEIQIGLGTTIIADIFLSFGAIGVVLLMFFLGYLINRLTISAVALNYYSVVFLGGMLANAIFIVRASYTHPVRYVLWALLIAYFNKILSVKWKK